MTILFEKFGKTVADFFFHYTKLNAAYKNFGHDYNMTNCFYLFDYFFR